MSLVENSRGLEIAVRIRIRSTWVAKLFRSDNLRRSVRNEAHHALRNADAITEREIFAKIYSTVFIASPYFVFVLFVEINVKYFAFDIESGKR